jgi:hypothetical protein
MSTTIAKPTTSTPTLTIEWTGAKNAAATDTNIGVDALDVAGTLTQVR